MTSEAGLFTVHHMLMLSWDSSHCAVTLVVIYILLSDTTNAVVDCCV